jgi:hypothetical protein
MVTVWSGQRDVVLDPKISLMESRSMSRKSLMVAAILIYLPLIGAVLGGMWRARTWAMAHFGSEQAQADWQSFRDAVAEDNRAAGPVQRRVPQSEEPPARVLMRDHFLVCTIIVSVLSTALYATLAMLLIGVLSERREPSAEGVAETARSRTSSH